MGISKTEYGPHGSFREGLTHISVYSGCSMCKRPPKRDPTPQGFVSQAPMLCFTFSQEKHAFI